MMNPRISIIAAIGENRELGKDNKLLWHISEDLQRFKQITMGKSQVNPEYGHTIIMGRKTFESIGRRNGLPHRLNIVLSRDPEKVGEGVIFMPIENDWEKLFKFAVTDWESKRDENDMEIFIIGGAQIYSQALPFVDKLYLTIVHQSFPKADVFFPDYSEFTKEIEREEKDNGEYKYTFLTLEK